MTFEVLTSKKILEKYYSLDYIQKLCKKNKIRYNKPKSELIDQLLGLNVYSNLDLLNMLEKEQLKWICKDYGEYCSGNKDDLIQRIIPYFNKPNSTYNNSIKETLTYHDPLLKEDNENSLSDMSSLFIKQRIIPPSNPPDIKSSKSPNKNIIIENPSKNKIKHDPIYNFYIKNKHIINIIGLIILPCLLLLVGIITVIITIILST
jgi:hypothetical protein